MLDEVLALRRDRMATVRTAVDGLTEGWHHRKFAERDLDALT